MCWSRVLNIISVTLLSALFDSFVSFGSDNMCSVLAADIDRLKNAVLKIAALCGALMV